MARRTGISEAPDVTLGKAGTEQFVPILERSTDTTKTPGKASIAQMAAYFNNDPITRNTQIQQFYISSTNQAQITAPLNHAVGVQTPTTRLALERDPRSLIAGDINYFQIIGGNIAVTEGGVYRLHGRVTAEVNLDLDRSTQDFEIDGNSDGSTQNIRLSENFYIEEVPADLTVEFDFDVDFPERNFQSEVSLQSRHQPRAWNALLTITGAGDPQIISGTGFQDGIFITQGRTTFIEWESFIMMPTAGQFQLFASTVNHGLFINDIAACTWEFTKAGFYPETVVTIENIT